MAVSTIPADRYIIKLYWCPTIKITAGTIGTPFDFGTYSDVSVPGYTARGAFIGKVDHALSYTPMVMVTQNRLYRWYVRVQSGEYTVPAADWSAYVVYEKN